MARCASTIWRPGEAIMCIAQSALAMAKEMGDKPMLLRDNWEWHISSNALAACAWRWDKTVELIFFSMVNLCICGERLAKTSP
jgi:hypothetical protein